MLLSKFAIICSNLFLIGGAALATLASLRSRSFIVCFKILQIGRLDLDFSFLVDWITLVFSRVLCIIVSCVLKFSKVYMERDIFQVRFTWLVLRFVVSMFCLIYIPHFFFLLIGWDGLGITSFLLVIYYLSDSSWAAGMKTFLINRIGDSFFILCLVLFLRKGYWEIKTARENDLLAFLIVLGCFTKSAQFPFSRWLPAAMAAPTPVSALVHSSTLVTAGIYVMIRFCHMLPPRAFLLIGIRGMWTLYSASLAACCEYDAKKIVAYSTLRQLGLMRVAISLKLPMIAFFHLITHAMFKALIFICVGYLINKRGHFQDLRRLKGLWSTSPVLAKTLIVRRLSLMGFPFLAGFFSKELILENKILIINWVFHALLLLSLPLTSYYRCRLCFKILNGANYKRFTCQKDGNVNFMSILPLYLGSIFSGTILSQYVYRRRSIFPCHTMKFFVTGFIIRGVLLRWYDIKVKNNSLIYFFSSICFLVPFKRSFWVKKMVNWGRDSFYLLDQGILRKRIFDIDLRRIKIRETLHNIFGYFLSPQAKYYMMTTRSMRVFVGLTVV